jgi:hypothetical protein
MRKRRAIRCFRRRSGHNSRPSCLRLPRVPSADSTKNYLDRRSRRVSRITSSRVRARVSWSSSPPAGMDFSGLMGSVGTGVVFCSVFSVFGTTFALLLSSAVARSLAVNMTAVAKRLASFIETERTAPQRRSSALSAMNKLDVQSRGCLHPDHVSELTETIGERTQEVFQPAAGTSVVCSRCFLAPRG